jgi:hypothetical protein
VGLVYNRLPRELYGVSLDGLAVAQDLFWNGLVCLSADRTGSLSFLFERVTPFFLFLIFGYFFLLGFGLVNVSKRARSFGMGWTDPSRAANAKTGEGPVLLNSITTFVHFSSKNQ